MAAKQPPSAAETLAGPLQQQLGEQSEGLWAAPRVTGSRSSRRCGFARGAKGIPSRSSLSAVARTNFCSSCFTRERWLQAPRSPTLDAAAEASRFGLRGRASRAASVWTESRPPSRSRGDGHQWSDAPIVSERRRLRRPVIYQSAILPIFQSSNMCSPRPVSAKSAHLNSMRRSRPHSKAP